MLRSAALCLAAGGLLTAGRPALAQAVAPVVRIGAITIDASGEAYYGTETGIFANSGFTPQVTTLTNGAAIMAAVLAGDLDIGISNPMQVAAALARGIPVQMIAPAALYSKRDASITIVVAKDSPFKEPKDLIGSTLAIGALSDFNQLSLLAWLESNNIPRDSIHLVELPLGEMGAAIQRGTVQAAFTSEPFKTTAVRAGQIRDFADTYLTIAPEIATTVWLATKGWLQKNPDTAKKVLNGIYATARWANAHVQESGVILAKVAKMDPAAVATMRRSYYATVNDRKYVESMLTLAAHFNMLARPVTYEEYTAFPS
ncbi:MAG TPA: ABC transporter substrate-binding protein [Candidatus Lustribacter sp.]|nr:ABC transporter substrate-binding protein [Candidatus Lustribacter sp.]